MIIKKKKSKSLRVHPDFYNRIEKERQKFMKDNDLTRLTTASFTKILDAKLINGKKFRKKRRR